MTVYKIKAEEGRAISGVDLRPLIQNMPVIEIQAQQSGC